MAELLTTERLVLRDWTPADAGAALTVYGDDEVARWLTPVMSRVSDEESMRAVLRDWSAESATSAPPYGHWAVVRRGDGRIIGGVALRPLPPDGEDVEVAWQLAREDWGHGYALEAARALAEWAFTQEAAELFAVVRPRNTRAAAMAERLGMEWTGETDKYYGLRLHVYRLRPENLGKERVEAPRS
jgi:RimJ/RimL family protein N-acetyltransferase